LAGNGKDSLILMLMFYDFVSKQVIKENVSSSLILISPEWLACDKITEH